MASPHAIRYRQKASELFEAAAAAPTDELRDQFANLAIQYEILAARMDGLAVSELRTSWLVH
jgi:hypothetical protein